MQQKSAVTAVRITWPLVALLVAFGLFFTLVAVFAPPAVHEQLFNAGGVVTTIVAWLLRSPVDVRNASTPASEAPARVEAPVDVDVTHDDA